MGYEHVVFKGTKTILTTKRYFDAVAPLLSGEATHVHSSYNGEHTRIYRPGGVLDWRKAGTSEWKTGSWNTAAKPKVRKPKATAKPKAKPKAKAKAKPRSKAKAKPRSKAKSKASPWTNQKGGHELA